MFKMLTYLTNVRKRKNNSSSYYEQSEEREQGCAEVSPVFWISSVWVSKKRVTSHCENQYDHKDQQIDPAGFLQPSPDACSVLLKDTNNTNTDCKN